MLVITFAVTHCFNFFFSFIVKKTGIFIILKINLASLSKTMKKNAHTFEFDELLDNVCVRFEC